MLLARKSGLFSFLIGYDVIYLGDSSFLFSHEVSILPGEDLSILFARGFDSYSAGLLIHEVSILLLGTTGAGFLTSSFFSLSSQDVSIFPVLACTLVSFATAEVVAGGVATGAGFGATFGLGLRGGNGGVGSSFYSNKEVLSLPVGSSEGFILFKDILLTAYSSSSFCF